MRSAGWKTNPFHPLPPISPPPPPPEIEAFDQNRSAPEKSDKMPSIQRWNGDPSVILIPQQHPHASYYSSPPSEGEYIRSSWKVRYGRFSSSSILAFFPLPLSLAPSILVPPLEGLTGRRGREGREGRGKREEVISLEQGLPVASPPFLERRLGAAFPGNAPKNEGSGKYNVWGFTV